MMIGVVLFLSLLSSQFYFIKPLPSAVDKIREDFSIQPHEYLEKDFTVPEAALSESISSTAMIGVGYSDDMQQVTQQPCFNATVASVSEREGSVSLDEALSFSDLQKKFEIDVSGGGGFGVFSANAKANYLRSLQDKDYSLSLNYYSSFSEKVTLKIGDGPLTESGKRLYNYSNNPYFGLVCGDNYIASYKQGAFLSMGLNIKLNSHEEKKVFTDKVKINIGPFNLFHATKKIQAVSITNKISGVATVHAFQIGGEPSQLTNILSSNIVKCNITAMEDCVLTANNLLNYAKTFGNQIVNSTRFEPLEYVHHPIKWITLKPAVSLVTPEITQYRKDLFNRLQENEYYKQKLYSFFEGYPIELDHVFLNEARLVMAKADNNIRALMNPRTGAAGCYNNPERCKEVKANLDARLQRITIDDLKFLEDVKFTIPIEHGVFFSNGNKTKSSWILLPINPNIIVDNANISDEACMYQLKFDKRIFIYNGTWNSTLMEYVGSYCIASNCNDNMRIKKHLSQFYFGKFIIN